MAKRKLPPAGPPTPIVSFAKLGEQNKRRRAKVKARGRKRAARFAGTNIDVVGERVKAHLDSETGIPWRLDIGTPRRIWARRFVFKPPRGAEVDWNSFESAYQAIDGDARIDSLMRARKASALIYVFDPDEGGVVVFTVAAYGDWRKAMFDMAFKVQKSVARYGILEGEDISDDEALDLHYIVQFTLLVGEKTK